MDSRPLLKDSTKIRVHVDSRTFDNLALKTNTQLGINLTDLRKVSLSNTSGDDFFREVKKRSKPICDQISSFMNFIKLIYTFRELVIHREGLSKTAFVYRDADGSWVANVVKLGESRECV